MTESPLEAGERPGFGPGAPAPASQRAPAGPVLLRARGMCKHFPGVVANADVDLDLRRGEVHTLLGENGAGKSTLAAMLSGFYRPDRGSMRLDGAPVRFSGPRDAQAHGIGMVHQHFRLVDRFTVAENVVLGDRRHPFRLRASDLEDRVVSVAEQFGMPVDPGAVVGDLSVGERQRVEIVKTLYRGAEILLLDEPTAVLTPPEVEALFATIRRMRESGKCVVFISHKLAEVMAISDVITVMRAGRVTGTVATAATDERDLARLMIGREVEMSVRRSASPAGAPLLRLSGVSLDVSGRRVIEGVDLEVRSGEIVGVAGVAGNGQRELVETIAGIRAPIAGRIEVCDRSVAGKGPRRSRAAGLAFVPEDRLGTGLAPSLSIAENLLLTRPKGFFVSRRRAEAEARRIIEEYDVKAPGPATPTRLLSGGNAQKVLLARELGDPSTQVAIVSSPTRGLDVGATESVRLRLDALRARGGAVLLVSEDLEEVLSLSDRVVVLYQGRILYECRGEAADRTTVGLAMAGVAPR